MKKCKLFQFYNDFEKDMELVKCKGCGESYWIEFDKLDDICWICGVAHCDNCSAKLHICVACNERIEGKVWVRTVDKKMYHLKCLRELSKRNDNENENDADKDYCDSCGQIMKREWMAVAYDKLYCPWCW